MEGGGGTGVATDKMEGGGVVDLDDGGGARPMG
jgi:hypothetical protein